MVQMHESGLDLTASVRERIATGSVVTLQALEDGDEWEVTIVSTDEADPDLNHISDECPIGEALLGRRAGDVIAAEVPVGTVRYRVLSVTAAGARITAAHRR